MIALIMEEIMNLINLITNTAKVKVYLDRKYIQDLAISKQILKDFINCGSQSVMTKIANDIKSQSRKIRHTFYDGYDMVLDKGIRIDNEVIIYYKTVGVIEDIPF